MVNRENYETGDFYIWLLQQAEALKAKELNNIDWENLAEEIEALAREQVREAGERVHQILLVKVRLDYLCIVQA